ncbi:MAG TPA: hypothetical protein VF469_19655 [Kofleriaceae bacterium]
MKYTIALSAVLLFACAKSAAAGPDGPKAPPHGDACRPAGKVLFEIDHKVIPNAQGETSTIKVFANGAWTREGVDASGKPEAQTSGCLDKDYTKELASSLHGVPWTVTTARIRCMAISPTFTEYRVDGKLVYTEKLCSGQNLDDKSRAALDSAVAHVAAAAKSEPSAKPSPAP